MKCFRLFVHFCSVSLIYCSSSGCYSPFCERSLLIEHLERYLLERKQHEERNTQIKHRDTCVLRRVIVCVTLRPHKVTATSRKPQGPCFLLLHFSLFKDSIVRSTPNVVVGEVTRLIQHKSSEIGERMFNVDMSHMTMKIGFLGSLNNARSFVLRMVPSILVIRFFLLRTALCFSAEAFYT